MSQMDPASTGPLTVEPSHLVNSAEPWRGKRRVRSVPKERASKTKHSQFLLGQVLVPTTFYHSAGRASGEGRYSSGGGQTMLVLLGCPALLKSTSNTPARSIKCVYSTLVVVGRCCFHPRRHHSPRNSWTMWQAVFLLYRHVPSFFGGSGFLAHMYKNILLILRGTIVNRTYGTHKNLCIYLFLLTIFGSRCYGPP